MTLHTAPAPDPNTWPDALHAFDQHLRERDVRHSTRKNYRHHLRALAHHTPAGPWAVTAPALAAWLDTRGGSRRTGLAVARLFYAWAACAGHIAPETNPVPERDPDRRRGPQATRLLDRFPTAWAGPVSRHLTALKGKGGSPRSIELHATYLARLAATHPDPYAVRADDLAAWLARHDWKPETRRSACAVLRSFYARAVRAGDLDTSPAADLDRVRVPRALPRPTTTTDALRAALATCTDHDRLMVLLGALAGLRAAEIAQVHPARDVREGFLYVTGKGGHARRVPVHPILSAELEAERTRRRRGAPGSGLRNLALSECSADGYLFPSPGGHMTPGTITRRVAAALPDGWTAHTLRHRFASQAYATERDLRAVQELLGHASPTTTARYTQVPGTALTAAVAGVGL